MTSEKCKDTIASVWRAAWSTDAISLGTKNLPPIDPFHDINPILFEMEQNNHLQPVCRLSEEERKNGY